jgi:hypothetical protein
LAPSVAFVYPHSEHEIRRDDTRHTDEYEVCTVTDNDGWNPTPNNTARTTKASTPRAQGELLWQAAHDGKTMTCELRDDSQASAGWEVLLRIDGEIVLGHRSHTEDIARYFANVFRQDHVRTGWAEISPKLEHRSVDARSTFTCPSCHREVDAPREEPWLIHGTQQHAPTLVAFACPHCDEEIRLD